MKILTQLKIDNSILGVITKFQSKILIVVRYVLNFSRVPRFFADFTIRMIRNETGHLLKCVKLYRKFFNINETQQVKRRNIDATSRKVSCTNLYSVKNYDETNMNIFTLSLWGKK